MNTCTYSFEEKAWAGGFSTVAGIDEVGRGALFGPVVACALVLRPELRVEGLNDSKQLTARQRERLAMELQGRGALAWGISEASAAEIDATNVLAASRLAMTRAVNRLALRGVEPDYLLVDALRLDLPIRQEPVIHGDALSASIAAASIVAKVWRDALMDALDAVFPLYGLKGHKGYGTKEHLKALREHGPTRFHRMTFKGVKDGN